LIKVRGWQVSPAEIEAVLVEHPGIADAAVIGVAASDETGEVPQAFVVRAEGGQIEEEDVKSFLRERLARYKEVEQVVFVDRIPKNPTGKILRRVLRAAREGQISTPDQEAATAYAKALRDLGKRELVRKVRSPSDRRSSRTQSRRASLTDASTIES
jgi:acyl-coenzyme A synthetase/AMP-(fatty) acid ligase